MIREVLQSSLVNNSHSRFEICKAEATVLDCTIKFQKKHPFLAILRDWHYFLREKTTLVMIKTKDKTVTAASCAKTSREQKLQYF